MKAPADRTPRWLALLAHVSRSWWLLTPWSMTVRRLG